MHRNLVCAILITVAPAIAAQAEQRPPASGPKPTVADVQRVVKLISADKAKLQTYCDVAKIEEEIDKAELSKDAKKADELIKKADELSQKLGPEYINLMVRLQQVDPSSKEGQQLSAAFEPLDKQCGGR